VKSESNREGVKKMEITAVKRNWKLKRVSRKANSRREILPLGYQKDNNRFRIATIRIFCYAGNGKLLTIVITNTNKTSNNFGGTFRISERLN